MRSRVFWGFTSALLVSAGQLNAQQPAIEEPQTRITLAPAQFDRYEGYYQLGPRVAIRLFREDSRFYMGMVGTTQKMEIFPETPERFAVGNWTIKIAPHRTITSQQGSAVDYWPSFTPDGHSILFSRSPDGGKSWSLFRVPVGGGSLQIVFERAGVAATRASSGLAGRIAFNVDNAIWTMQGKGSEAHMVPLKDVIAASLSNPGEAARTATTPSSS